MATFGNVLMGKVGISLQVRSDATYKKYEDDPPIDVYSFALKPEDVRGPLVSDIISAWAFS